MENAIGKNNILLNLLLEMDNVLNLLENPDLEILANQASEQ